MNSSDPNSHEVLICQTATSSVFAETTRDASGAPVQRLSSRDIIPSKALEIAKTAKSVIGKNCGIDPSMLRVSMQTRQGQDASGLVYGGAALLLDARALEHEPSILEMARACAAEFADVLRPTRKVDLAQTGTSTVEIEGVRSRPPLSLNDLEGSELLGAILPQALNIIVPGLRRVRLEGRIKRLDRRDFRTRDLMVRGHLRSVAVGGRGHRLFLRGTELSDSSNFGNHAVSFPESLRSRVAAALEKAGQRVLLSIAEETLDEGRAKPRVKRLLKSIELLPMAGENTAH